MSDHVLRILLQRVRVDHVAVDCRRGPRVRSALGQFIHSASSRFVVYNFPLVLDVVVVVVHGRHLDALRADPIEVAGVASQVAELVVVLLVVALASLARQVHVDDLQPRRLDGREREDAVIRGAVYV